MKTIRTRFAPSPTGYLHIGGMRTALYAYLYAKQSGGAFVLRIEDTDQERLVQDACELIYDTMKDAGLNYDEGPDVGGDFGPYIQSQRREIYHEWAAKLIESGDAYYCFCTKERLAEAREAGGTKYDKHCMKLSKQEVAERIANGESYVIRQNVPTSGKYTFHDLVFGDVTVDYGELEDNVLIKSDGLPTYNFANVVDDHLMEITHVIRGVEYLSSTPKYDLLYKAFGWEVPTYIHVQPIMKDGQKKLSKRDGAATYADFIAKGYLKEGIINYIALLGWSPKGDIEKFDIQFLTENFNVEGLSRSPSIFDETKMKWLNGKYIAEMPADKFAAMARPYMDKHEYLNNVDKTYLASLVQSRVDILSEVDDLTEFIGNHHMLTPDMFYSKKNKTDSKFAIEVLPDLSAITRQRFDNLYEVLCEYADACGHKKASILWVYRIALTASVVTPGGASEMAKLFGRMGSSERLDNAYAMLTAK